MATHLLRTLRYLKAIAREQRAVVAVSAPLYLFPKPYTARAVSTADCVLRVTALPDDAPLLQVIANPLHCVALLQVLKLPALGTLATHVYGDGLHVVRHRRKCLEIGEVVVDPDKEGEGGV